VPENGAQMPVVVPDGLIPVKVIDAATRRPMVAKVVWLGNGSRVEAMTNANGDALLEGVGSTGGRLTISARSHQTLEGVFTETPDTLQEIALTPLRSEAIVVTITTEDHQPLRNAVVEAMSERVGDPSEMSATDDLGVVRLSQLSPGALRLRAHADGFIDGAARVTEEYRGAVSIALARAK
jgi:hypothetical protein